MNYFPMFMDIDGREVFICGGGTHAAEKIEKLRPFHPRLQVISENISPAIKNTANLSFQRRKLSKDDLYSHPIFVIAAESMEENKRIAGICNEMHVPVNATDQPENCELIFSSMVISHYLCGDIDTISLWIKSLKEKLTCKQMETDMRNKILHLAMNEALSRERILTEQEVNQICQSA